MSYENLRKLFIEEVLNKLEELGKEDNEEESSQINDEFIQDILNLGDKLNIDKSLLTDGVLEEGKIIDFCKRNFNKFKNYAIKVLGTLLLTLCFTTNANAVSVKDNLKLYDIDNVSQKENTVEFIYDIKREGVENLLKSIIKKFEDKNTIHNFASNPSFKSKETATLYTDGRHRLIYNMDKGTISTQILIRDTNYNQDEAPKQTENNVRDIFSYVLSSMTNTDANEIVCYREKHIDKDSKEDLLMLEIENIKPTKEILSQIQHILKLHDIQKPENLSKLR